MTGILAVVRAVVELFFRSFSMGVDGLVLLVRMHVEGLVALAFILAVTGWVPSWIREDPELAERLERILERMRRA